MRWSRQVGKTALAAAIASSAPAQTPRTVLPLPLPPFTGRIAENVTEPVPGFQRAVGAPQGAPNMFVMMSDDVGFAMGSTFGGPVPTPNLDRIAQRRQRYNQFHTTRICSPSARRC